MYYQISFPKENSGKKREENWVSAGLNKPLGHWHRRSTELLVLLRSLSVTHCQKGRVESRHGFDGEGLSSSVRYIVCITRELWIFALRRSGWPYGLVRCPLLSSYSSAVLGWLGNLGKSFDWRIYHPN